jgi:hypothetical protein
MANHGVGLQTVEGPFVEQTWDVTTPELRELLDYWLEVRGDRSCPRWSDFQLPVIYKLAPHIVVKDAVDGGADFRNRFWGTAVTEWLRFDASGQLLSDYFPDAGRDMILDAHRLALHSDKPVRRWGISVYPDRNYVAFETLDLPLENDQGERAHIVSMTLYKMVPARSAPKLD